MKFIRVLLLVSGFSGFTKASKQTIFSKARPEGTDELELTSLSSERFTTFSHPMFPGKNARIKKSDFCDGTVASYTGYIDVGPNHFFFFFFESRNDSETDDVLLWTNGGPGCSSSMGLFMELGPCNIATPNSTKYNPYSWNTNANVFFIDQPIGVGFSYNDFGDAPYTSEEAGVDIAAFAAMFFETFSKFKGHSFHLTGESYAACYSSIFKGRYLPVYASAIYDQNEILVTNGYAPVNLKSVMIGNEATDFSYLFQSYYDMQCTKVSMEPVQSISSCVRMKQVLPRCAKTHKESCVDHFDLIDCNAAFDFCSLELMQPVAAIGYNFYDLSMKCRPEDCYPERSSVSAFNLTFEDTPDNSFKHRFIANYLNLPEIRKVLGVDPEFGEYKQYSEIVGNHFGMSGDMFHQTQLYVAELLARGVKVLIYAGSYDFACNWVGNERWTLEMDWEGREVFASISLREWNVQGSPAGKTRSYGNLSFATIYGAGHMVPHDKPVESLEMLKRWLADEDF